MIKMKIKTEGYLAAQAALPNAGQQKKKHLDDHKLELLEVPVERVFDVGDVALAKKIGVTSYENDKTI